MLIVCPSCATSYDVEAASLGPNGRRVRCVRCRTVWQAELPHADKLVAAAALAPGAAPDATAAEAAPERGPDQEAAEAGSSAEPAAPLDDWLDAGATAEAPIGGADLAEADGAAAPSDAAGPIDVESPPTAPVDGDDEITPAAGGTDDGRALGFEPPQDVESVAARRAKRSPQPNRPGLWPLTRLQTSILVMLIIDAIVIGWRSDFVRLLPQTESFYALIGMPVNLRGLIFDGLATTTEQHENVPILVVEGQIINTSRKLVEIPHLRFAVRNAAHQEIYSWTAVPPRPALPAGEAIGFRSRLASPPPDAHDVLVRFLNRYDIMHGAR